jgi:hypothetical protein
MADKIYVKGIRSFKKNDKAPDFVLGDGVIDIQELINFLNSEEVNQFVTEYQGNPQLKIQFLTFEGKISVVVNTYRKEG